MRVNSLCCQQVTAETLAYSCNTEPEEFQQAMLFSFFLRRRRGITNRGNYIKGLHRRTQLLKSINAHSLNYFIDLSPSAVRQISENYKVDLSTLDDQQTLSFVQFLPDIFEEGGYVQIKTLRSKLLNFICIVCTKSQI